MSSRCNMYQDVERVSDKYIQQAVPLSVLYTWTTCMLACGDDVDEDDAGDDTELQDIHQVEIYVSRCRKGLTNSDTYLQQAVPLSVLYIQPPGLLA